MTVDRLDNMKSRSIDTRTMMSITKEEVEHLILNNYCQPGMKSISFDVKNVIRDEP